MKKFAELFEKIKQEKKLLIVFAMLTEPLLRYLSLLTTKVNALYRRLRKKILHSGKREQTYGSIDE